MMRSRILIALAALLALVAPAAAFAAQCAVPGRDGSPSGLTGIVNTYYPATASAAAGATTITLGTATGATTPIAIGDLLLVIQMQDATISSTNNDAYGNNTSGDNVGQGATSIGASGTYEYVRAASAVTVSGGSLTLVGGGGAGLVNAYVNANPSANGNTVQRRFQVIRVPQYRDVSLGAGLTSGLWNGTTGGVLAIDVSGTLSLAGGSATVNGRGFRGGAGRQLAGGSGADGDYRTLSSVAINGSKGEGIAGTPRYVNNNGSLLDTTFEGYPNGSHARGAPGNAGGGGTDGNAAANDENTGGGGGGNGGAGGRGGHAWCSTVPSGCAQTGGFGGDDITTLGVTRVTMGGGGGAGATNNGTGTPASGLASSGAAGGGIVMIRAGLMSGAGTITANGASAVSTVLNDGTGGGGAGGSVLVSALSTSGLSLSVSAAGGNGGTNTGGGSAHGPGGGGGGGFAGGSFALSASVGGGNAGTTGGSTGSFTSSYGAVGGSSGTTVTFATSAVPGISSGAECTPTITKSFSPANVGVGQTSRLTLTYVNRNPTVAISSVAFTDTYPAAIKNSSTPASAIGGTGCTGTITAAANAGSVALASGAIPAAGTCTIGVNVVGTAAGAQVNTIAAGGLTGTTGGQSTPSDTAATATLTVLPPLTATKSVQAYSDPFNATTNPKSIPGGFVAYTITVTNPTSQATDSNTVYIMDAVPANTRLFVNDAGAAGSGPITFTDGSPASGLAYSYTNLASTTDGLEFSNVASPDPANAAHWTYVPTPDASGVDGNVTYIRVKPTGALNAGASFSIRFIAQVK